MLTGLDKLQIASYRLTDTIRGHFHGDHPVSTIDNARAIGELIRDMNRTYTRNGLIKKIKLFTDPIQVEQADTQINKQHRLLSNFAKHADKDNDIYAKRPYLYCDAMLALRYVAEDYLNFTETLEANDLATIEEDDYWRYETHNFYGYEGNTPQILSCLFLDWYKDWSQYILSYIENNPDIENLPDDEFEEHQKKLLPFNHHKFNFYKDHIESELLSGNNPAPGIRLIHAEDMTLPEIRRFFSIDLEQ